MSELDVKDALIRLDDLLFKVEEVLQFTEQNISEDRSMTEKEIPDAFLECQEYIQQARILLFQITDNHPLIEAVKALLRHEVGMRGCGDSANETAPILKAVIDAKAHSVSIDCPQPSAVSVTTYESEANKLLNDGWQLMAAFKHFDGETEDFKWVFHK